MKHETAQEVLRAAPPVGVGGLTLFGAPLSEWVLILTAIYTIFLIIDKAPSVWVKLRSLWRKERTGQRSSDEARNDEGN